MKMLMIIFPQCRNILHIWEEMAPKTETQINQCFKWQKTHRNTKRTERNGCYTKGKKINAFQQFIQTCHLGSIGYDCQMWNNRPRRFILYYSFEMTEKPDWKSLWKKTVVKLHCTRKSIQKRTGIIIKSIYNVDQCPLSRTFWATAS